MGDQEVVHIVGMLLFVGENSFQHYAGGRILFAEIADQFPIMLARDALGNEIFLIISIRFAPSMYSEAARVASPSD